MMRHATLRPGFVCLGGKSRLAFALGFILMASGPVGSWAQDKTISSRKDALKVMFGASERVRMVKRELDDKSRAKLRGALGISSLKKKRYEFYIGETDGKPDGYALILDEKGKFLPITFLVGVDPGGKVKMVEILKYREPIGGEVRHPRFTRQFKGKDASDPIKIRKDIKNISGATISSSAVCLGVKKAVLLVQGFFLDPPKPKGTPKATPSPPKPKAKADQPKPGTKNQ
ncbi:MAG: FMN-binding protein [Planctomycetota bacterium]|nr:FMN-binding protein [Planctomycetota bacterium]